MKHTYNLLIFSFIFLFNNLYSQEIKWISSTEESIWNKDKVRLIKKVNRNVDLEINYSNIISVFNSWGVTFNELCWDALCILSSDEQDEILSKIFHENGDLCITRGRIPLGANDYARSWYSCDEVEGDFELRYFNIDRDKQTIIPFIKNAQKYNKNLTFWISPWSPPTWMKINGDYPVLSNKYNNLSPKLDYLLFGSVGGIIDSDEMKLLGERNRKFPRQLATTDYMIQDSRYLKTYADYFCKFIDAYAKQGIYIDMIMYQNEAYSYTPYLGCAWTAEGTVRFNRDYLAPILKQKHPDVKLYLGTFNTNREDYVDKILSDDKLRQYISGLGFQWEGREILESIRKKYPNWNYICSESECGWGSFDWKSAEHTFELINHYLGNGCNEYNLWNFILADNGESTWGWKQNALIRVYSESRTFTYTPEYYAVKHYAHFIKKGSKIVAYRPLGYDNKPVLVSLGSNGDIVITAGNFLNKEQKLTIKVYNKYLDVMLKPHSMNTFIYK